MVRCQRAPSRLRLFDLLFLASAASAASALSLSSFRLISSNGLPLACIIAYNTPIPGCTNSDFTTGNTCSSTCIAGIEKTVSIIQSACDQVDPGDNTILILAMNGRLVNALCPNNGNGDDNLTTTTVRVTASGTRSATSATSTTSPTSPTSTTTSARRSTTIPSTVSRSTRNTSSTSSAASPAQSQSTAESIPTTSLAVTSSSDIPITTSTTSSSIITSTTSTEAAKQTNPFANGGGGSPFDQSTRFSAAPPRSQARWWLATVAAVFATGWTLAQ